MYLLFPVYEVPAIRVNTSKSTYTFTSVIMGQAQEKVVLIVGSSIKTLDEAVHMNRMVIVLAAMDINENLEQTSDHYIEPR